MMNAEKINAALFMLNKWLNMKDIVDGLGPRENLTNIEECLSWAEQQFKRFTKEEKPEQQEEQVEQIEEQIKSVEQVEQIEEKAAEKKRQTLKIILKHITLKSEAFNLDNFQLPAYHVILEDKDSVWDENIRSFPELSCFFRGIQAMASFLDLYVQIPFVHDGSRGNDVEDSIAITEIT